MAANLKEISQSERLLSGKITALLSDSATSITVDNPPSASKLPTYFELDYDTDDAEVVRVTNVSGNTITIERGVNSGGVGVLHLNNALWKQKFTSYAWQQVVTALTTGYITVDTSYTFTRVSTSSFKITAAGVDKTTLFTKNRIVRLNGSVVVTVVSSSYSNPDTTITVVETTVPTPITSVEVDIAPLGGVGGFLTSSDIGSTIQAYDSDLTAWAGKTAPSGTVVGTSDSQALTNKTVTDTSNNVAAKSLHSASTVVDVVAATAPSTGQVLTATDSTHATWQTPSTGALTSKIITATRDMTAGSGSVAYTGVGFQPTAILAIGIIQGGSYYSSLGVVDSTGSSSDTSIQFGTAGGANQASLLKISTAGSTEQTADFTSFDADGFTLAWTKTGSPTGTAYLTFLCFK